MNKRIVQVFWVSILVLALVAGVTVALTAAVIALPIVAFVITIFLIVRGGGKNWGGNRPSDRVPISKMFRQ